MSEELSPESDNMDISETSERSAESTKTVKNEDLDNERPEKSPTTYKCLSKSTVTNSHPLMNSPDGEAQINENFVKYEPRIDNFNPKAHSSMLNLVAKVDTEAPSDLDLGLPNIESYNEELPEFPESPTAMKKSMLYDMPLEISPTNDLSDTENDRSIYEAVLSPNLQNVSLTMNEKHGNLNFLSQVSRSNKLRKIKVDTTAHNDDSDVSSIESISESIKSEDVFPDNPTNNLSVDMNFIKELLDSPDDMEDSMLDGPDFERKEGEESNTPEPIREYSAEEERRDSRHWLKVELPNGKQRIIDMRVIEPYKRVLSHGGYLQAGGHNAIIIFSACFLPDKSRKDYVYVMDNLFLYVLQTLDQLVTEDYVLVYLHGSASSHCIPTIGWLKRCYQLIDRRLRKNLKHLYIVHPTFWLKTIIMMTKPFISAKFYRKIHFINSIQELTNCLPLENAAIPERVINYDKLKFCT